MSIWDVVIEIKCQRCGENHGDHYEKTLIGGEGSVATRWVCFACGQSEEEKAIWKKACKQA